MHGSRFNLTATNEPPGTYGYVSGAGGGAGRDRGLEVGMFSIISSTSGMHIHIHPWIQTIESTTNYVNLYGAGGWQGWGGGFGGVWMFGTISSTSGMHNNGFRVEQSTLK